MKPTEPIQPKAFRLLDLAPELRNRIYQYAFLGHSRHEHAHAWPPAIDMNGPRVGVFVKIQRLQGINWNLLLCCKQVYWEAKTLPYELNTFQINLLLDHHHRHHSLSQETWQSIIPRLRHVSLFLGGFVETVRIFVQLLRDAHPDLKIHALDTYFRPDSLCKIAEIQKFRVVERLTC